MHPNEHRLKKKRTIKSVKFQLYPFFVKAFLPVSGFLLGCLVFLMIYGVDPLRVTGSAWIFNGVIESDILQHYAGWMFFRDSVWIWPLGLAINMGYPIGANISYTDSIPIVSIFFKLISAWLPEHFQFFGLYTILSFGLQGAASALLIRIFTKNKISVMLGSLLFIFSSCMIERAFRHTALASHWLVLFALFFFFKHKKEPEWRWSWPFAILNCLAIGIHPYLFAMVFTIFFCTVISSSIENYRKKQSNRTVVIPFLINLAVSLTAGYSIGLFDSEQIKPADGFGFYSLNLNHFLNPSAKGIEKWALLFPKLPQIEGQEDGLYYLGAGMLLFSAGLILYIAVKLFSRKQKKSDFGFRIKYYTKEYAVLLIACLGFLIFSLSNRVTLNDTVIFSYPLPQFLLSLCNLFRSSGRFFIVIYYLWFLVVIVAVVRFFPRQKNSLLLLLAVIQIADMSPALIYKHEYFRQDFERPYLAEIWENVEQNYSKMIVLGENRDVQLAGWIADNHMKTNMMFSAPVHLNKFWEITKPDREKLLDKILSGQELDEDTVYIFDDEALLPEITAGLNPKYEIIKTDNYYHVYYMILPKETG